MRTQILAVILAAVAGLMTSAGLVNAAQFKVNTTDMTMQANPKIKVVRHLSCKVWGTPSEFPDTVLLTNDGNITIPAGTRIHWRVKNGARSGNFTFPHALAVGGSIYAPEPGGYARGAICDVSFITRPRHLRKPNNMTMNPNRPILKLAPLRVRCFAAGPAEFPDRLVFNNDGPRTIPMGTHVHWAFNAKVQGTYTFGKPLPHGKSIGMPLYPSPGGNAKCSASVVK